MGKRTQISASDLFVLMDREYRRRRPKECSECALPFPFHANEAGGKANWEIVPPEGCGLGCAYVIEEVVAQHQQLYDLFANGGSGRGK